ncbi:MAG: DNA (cytosine-5)-methyltransferase 1 [Phycisphaerales bacterium]|jgi:DNA (cytosine-5)-methyltransferase 1
MINKKVQEFILGEMFCGPGGIAQGSILSKSQRSIDGLLYSIVPHWATDYDEDTCKTYSKNIHGTLDSPHVICSDIRQMNIKELPDCDGFAFGFPCNDFSIVGESKGLEGSYGPLYKYGIEYLETHQPKWFVAENVSGLSSANKGDALALILEEMNLAGYVLAAHKYKFEEYGVPQARHRIIIVGVRKDIGLEFKIPAPTHLHKKVSSQEAIEKPAIKQDAENHEFTRQSKQVIERLKHIKPGDNAWSEDIPENLRLNVKGARLSNIYKRLNPALPAYTVTGSGGGGTHMYHWKEHRALTNRERARLQTFPDNFVFVGKKESVRKQIGMAVPPLAALVIFDALLSLFARKDYAYIHPNIESCVTTS